MHSQQCSVRGQVLDVDDTSSIYEAMVAAPESLHEISDGTPRSRRKKAVTESAVAVSAAAHDDDDDDGEGDGDGGKSDRKAAGKGKKQKGKGEKAKKQKNKKRAMTDQAVELLVTTRDDMFDFLLVMGLCHTLVLQADDDGDDDDEADGGSASGAAAQAGDVELKAAKQSKDKKKQKKKKKKGQDSGDDSDDLDNDEARRSSQSGQASHAPIPDSEFVAPAYTGQSPDEVALARAAANNGVAFMGSNKTIYTLRVRNSEDNMWYEQQFEVLATLEFSSDRRRMSVIVRRPDGRVSLLCKGADYIVAHRLEAATTQQLREATQADINSFSRTGLRTLMLAHRELNKKSYKTWAKKWQSAITRIDEGREEAMDELMSEVESDLRLLGCTAIEGK